MEEKCCYSALFFQDLFEYISLTWLDWLLLLRAGRVLPAGIAKEAGRAVWPRGLSLGRGREARVRLARPKPAGVGASVNAAVTRIDVAPAHRGPASG